jgi:hypothetical protein
MIKKKVMDQIIKKMSEKQNKKSKLNAGQLREAVSLFLKSLIELSEAEKLELIQGLSKNG